MISLLKLRLSLTLIATIFIPRYRAKYVLVKKKVVHG